MRIWHPRTPMQATITAVAFVLAAAAATNAGAALGGPLAGLAAGAAVCLLIPVIIR